MNKYPKLFCDAMAPGYRKEDEKKLFSNYNSYLFSRRHRNSYFYNYDQWVFKFPNKYGLSIISNTDIVNGYFTSLGNISAPFEVMLISFFEDNEDWRLCGEEQGFNSYLDVLKIIEKVIISEKPEMYFPY